MVFRAPTIPGTTESERRPGALVIGGDYIALGTVRSLGRRGIPVWIMHDGQHICAAASRFVTHVLSWPMDETARLDTLLNVSARYSLSDWVLYPADDESSALVARHHDVLSRSFRLNTSPWTVVQWAYDKRLTYKLASEIGVDHPKTYYPQNMEEVIGLECTFPCILKPAIKPKLNRLTKARAWRVEDHHQLIERYAEACKLADPSSIMIQELIEGGGEGQFSFAALCADGEPLAWLVARRVRQHPIDFGGHGSSFVETVDEPAIEEPARQLLAAIAYTGLVEIEFKCDPQSGQPKLLDINARTWGWHTLGRAAGVDFPYLSWRLAHGEVIPNTRGRAGVRWIRAATDVLAGWSEIRRGRLSLGGYIQSIRPPLEWAILALDDPLPACTELPWRLYRQWRTRSGIHASLLHPR
jgi:predicted ATP-grasp superfamily ATP-dependent carboligase